MCTVTYLPQGNGRFALTSSRDESQNRSTRSLSSLAIANENVVYPVDPISGGSWIAVSNSNKVACILNGAFEKHQHQPPYSRSRGLVLLDYFRWPEFSKFSMEYEFEGIEPFTMVVCEVNNLIEFRWDGSRGHIKNLSHDIPHIWSSSTLYENEARSRRKCWFKEWLLAVPTPQIKDQFDFHQYGGIPDPHNGLVMNRDGKVQTISITGIDNRCSFATIEHRDLISDCTIKRSIDFFANEVMESHKA
jgi:hypothetical protein